LQAEELVRRGHAVTVICPAFAGTRSTVVNGVLVRRLPAAAKQPFRRVTYGLALSAYLALRLRHFDLVHVHNSFPSSNIVSAAAWLLGRPVYVTVAGGGQYGDVAHMRKTAWLTRYAGLRLAGRVQALSNEIASEVERVGVKPERIARIPNGIDVGRHRPVNAAARLAARRRLRLPERKTIVLFAGRPARHKGIVELVDAWRRLRESSGAVLVLVGRTGSKDEVEIPADGPQMILRPWSDAIADYYAAADVFVLASRSEGMSNALLEAMASGLPVVATRVGAAAEMIEHQKTGLLVEPGDRAALAESLSSLLNDSGLRRRLGRAAREAVAGRFAVRAVVDLIEAEYRDLVEPGGKA
jgi:glycosyltransferase involved in cell wall biosynthesis